MTALTLLPMLPGVPVAAARTWLQPLKGCAVGRLERFVVLEQDECQSVNSLHINYIVTLHCLGPGLCPQTNKQTSLNVYRRVGVKIGNTIHVQAEQC